MEYVYNAFCERVIDGDTVVCVVDLGFKIKTTQIFRLADIDAHELRDKNKGKHDKAILEKLFVENAILGKQITIKSKKTGKYGRWIGEITYFCKFDNSYKDLGKSIVKYQQMSEV